jgi:hypothetical protein
MLIVARRARRVQAIVSAVLLLLPAFVRAQARREGPVPREIVEEIFKDARGWEIMPDRVDSLAANLIAAPLELNGDRTPELYVHGINSMCGANNCAGWIYRRTAKGFERLLDLGSAQNVEVQSTVSHGYRDIIASGHFSAWESELTLYKFDGRQYVRTRCYTRKYSYFDAAGEIHELKRPRIAQVACTP